METSFVLVSMCAFALGMIAGGALVMGYFASLVGKALRLVAGRATSTTAAPPGSSQIATDLGAMPVDKRNRIMAIIKEVAVCSEQQGAYLGQINQPSKNALHSKFKNDIIRHIKDLETRKIDLFRRILKEGYDPEIPSTAPDGTAVRVKLSVAVAQHESGDSAPPVAAPPTTPKSTEFAVIKSTTPSEGAAILQFVRPTKKE